MPKYSNTSKPTRFANRENLGRAPRLTGVYLGYVKASADKQYMGRLSVWIPEFGTNENDESGWYVVSYCSPFAGKSDPRSIGKGSDKVETFDHGTQSYGLWLVPPDLNNQVLVMFINGDPARGIWIGSLYGEHMNQMIPSVAANKTYEDSAVNLPTIEYNKNEIRNINPNNTTRPPHRYVTDGLIEQGLLRDDLRGTTNASARRDCPSEVYGLLTPGPVDTGNTSHRKGGHSITLDDKEGHEHIRFRTRSGAQIRIDETYGIIYIINKKGTAWVQLDDEGNVDVYSAQSVSIRSEADLNFRADKDINIEAGQNIHIKAAKDSTANGDIVGEDNGEGGNIRIQAVNELHTEVKHNTYVTVTDGNYYVTVKTGTKDEYVVGDTKFKTEGNRDDVIIGNRTIKVEGNSDQLTIGDLNVEAENIAMKALNNTDIQSTVDTNLLGAKININSGGGAMGAASALDAALVLATPKNTNAHNNIIIDEYITKYDRNTQEIQSIVNRFMTHEPCPAHIVKSKE